jgi:BolA protein
MTVADAIRRKLTEEFHPVSLAVVDESHLHAGHAGARDGGETHFRIEIVSDHFAGLSRVDRHRQVNAVLAEELRGGVHALAIAARTPAETSRGGG